MRKMEPRTLVSPNIGESAYKEVTICGVHHSLTPDDRHLRTALRVLQRCVCDEQGVVLRGTVTYDFVLKFAGAIAFNTGNGRILHPTTMGSLRDIKQYIECVADQLHAIQPPRRGRPRMAPAGDQRMRA